MRVERRKVFTQSSIAKTILAILAFAVAASSAAEDGDFLVAREAFRVGHAQKLDSAAARLRDHPLYPYVAYWQLRLRLNDAEKSDVDAFLLRHGETPLAAQLTSDWLKVLGRRGEWQRLAFELKDFKHKPDAELSCFATLSRIKTKDAGGIDEGRARWLSAEELPDSCNELFAYLIAQKALSKDLVWRRVRLALNAGNRGVAKDVMQHLPKSERVDTKLLNQVSARPNRYLAPGKLKLTTRTGRELWLHALLKAARSDLHGSVRQWVKTSRQFPEADRGFVWAELATLAARRHDPAALGWYVAAADLTPEQREWRVRASLRTQDWEKVLAAIGDLPETHQAYATWSYWKARALNNLGRGAEAQPILASLAGEFHFYGQLAAEEIGSPITVPPQTFKASDGEIATMAKRPAIARALAFYDLDLRVEANREWAYAIRDFNDVDLLTAAELVRRLGLYDRTIYTAERTLYTHDFSLRYLTPFREIMRPAAAQLDLDEAWVYGLIRQESRFITSARSSVGAQGLMQVMPTTAKWVAKRLGLGRLRLAELSEVDTNIQLGSNYLKIVLEDLDEHPLLASAAYNAGPGRARQWSGDKPLEGAIYAETIPFDETRDYVKKVMGSATWYAGLLGGKIRSLKQRLGTISKSAFVSDDVLWEEVKPRPLPELDLEIEVIEASPAPGEKTVPTEETQDAGFGTQEWVKPRPFILDPDS